MPSSVMTRASAAFSLTLNRQLGRRPRGFERGCPETKRRSRNRQLDTRGAEEGLELAPNLEVPVLAYLGNRPDGSRGNLPLSTLGEDLRARPFHEPRCQQRVDLVGVLEVHLHPRAETPVRRPLR